MGSHKGQVVGQNPLPLPVFDTVQDMVGFLGYLCTLLAHVELLAHQHCKIPLPRRAALDPFSAQPLFALGIVLVQDLALEVVGLHEVCTDLPCKL